MPFPKSQENNFIHENPFLNYKKINTKKPGKILSVHYLNDKPSSYSSYSNYFHLKELFLALFVLQFSTKYKFHYTCCIYFTIYIHYLCHYKHSYSIFSYIRKIQFKCFNISAFPKHFKNFKKSKKNSSFVREQLSRIRL